MSCCVPGCPTRKRANKPQYKDVSLHVFPRKEEIGREWLELVRLPLVTNTTYLRVCSKHFLEKDFFMAGMQRDLHRRVLPSVFEWNQWNKEPVTNTQTFENMLPLFEEATSNSMLVKEKCNCDLLQEENHRLKLEISTLKQELADLKQVKEDTLKLLDSMVQMKEEIAIIKTPINSQNQCEIKLQFSIERFENVPSKNILI